MSQWISVKERLPEPDQFVLAERYVTALETAEINNPGRRHQQRLRREVPVRVWHRNGEYEVRRLAHGTYQVSRFINGEVSPRSRSVRTEGRVGQEVIAKAIEQGKVIEQ